MFADDLGTNGEVEVELEALLPLLSSLGEKVVSTSFH
jgi:hypothetical protein